MYTCALALRATFAALGRPQLAVSCIRLDDPTLTIGCVAVTTITADCVKCAAGTYQDEDSEQFGQCVPCFHGKYATGAPTLLISVSFESRATSDRCVRRQPYFS